MKVTWDEVLQPWLDVYGPAMEEASRLAAQYELASMDDLPALAERLGVQVVYSHRLGGEPGGFSTAVGGTPCIVVNARRHPKHQAVTIAHEIAHHRLDLQTHCSVEDGDRELRADFFAMWLVIRLVPPQERDDYFKANHVALTRGTLCMVVPVAALAVFGIMKLFSWLGSRITGQVRPDGELPSLDAPRR